MSTPRARRQIVVRHARPGDQPALERLAGLDSGRVPVGETLVAEVDGELVAALPVDGGAAVDRGAAAVDGGAAADRGAAVTGRAAVADPFRHTADLVSLLELRAAQVALDARGGARRSRRGLAALTPGLARRHRAA